MSSRLQTLKERRANEYVQLWTSHLTCLRPTGRFPHFIWILEKKARTSKDLQLFMKYSELFMDIDILQHGGDLALV
ncbi:hypothetical protein AOLI_G00023010 [Acnodon oligacanthus]